MSKSKVVQAAEARIAELEAAITAEADAKKAAQQAVAPAVARKERLSKKLAKMLLLTEAGGSPYSEGGGIRLRSLDSITLGWHNTERKPAELAKALLSGEVKIEAIGGIAYTLRGFLRRSRSTTVAQLWAVRRAEAKRKRAEDALKAAWKAEREAYAEAFGIGIKFDEVAVAKLVADKLAINTRPPSIDPEVYEAARNASNELSWARQHLEWAKATNPDKGVCPCINCQHDRREAAEAKAEAERIATLPSLLFQCPYCSKRHRGATDRRSTSFTEAQAAELLEKFGVKVSPYQRVEVPRGFCGKSQKWVMLATLWATEQAKAAKLEAKAKARVKSIRFVCPNVECGEEVEAVPDGDEVECPMCEVGLMVESLRLIKKAA